MPTPAILITGVSSGIGLVTALDLIDRGYYVYGSLRGTEVPVELAEAPNFTPLNFDVRDREAISAGISRIGEEGRPLIGVVNNAGVAIPGPVETLAEEEYRRQFEVNVFGLIAVCQLALPLLHAAREEGHHPRIVNISSVSGSLTAPYMTFYSSSKFAVEALTDGLRRELLPFGIDVVSVAPGPTKTPIWRKGSQLTEAFEKDRYQHLVPQLEPYTQAAERGGVEPQLVADAIYAALTDARPDAYALIMNKRWLARVVSKMPKRWQDRFLTKRYR
ncbi:SDR family NAD(P)-dependent oxidoreductase [Lewinella sp. IMCC34191]|uniref:SDR family NAD(P)-dependent oxidoreductase n=1 Tax=Lewinella sp. IMCC34191 TaxID=2259172 RepID=UPI0013009E96|nr:SDR family NAD(P)-dependent oxidoreductase [Lewinella sp. IMCC34191]